MSKALRLRMLVDAYRLYGHQFADIDPLNYPSYKHGAQLRKVLDYRSYGFTDADLDQEINTADGSTGIAEKVPKKWNLRGLIGYLEKVYCGKVGFECMHMLNKAERNFLRDRFEDLDKFEPSKEAKRETFHKLLQDHCFNEILEKRFGSSKRFGDEGTRIGISRPELNYLRTSRDTSGGCEQGMRVYGLRNGASRPFVYPALHLR